MASTKQQHRFLVALPRSQAAISLAWRLLDDDARDAAFHVQRRAAGEASWLTVTPDPITTATSMLDTTPSAGRYEYRVIGPNHTPSEVVSVDSAAPASCVAMSIPLPDGDHVTHIALGELTNDGRIGYVTRAVRDGRIWVVAYAHDGARLWEIDTLLPAVGGWDGHTHHVPIACWDINHDGRTEVVFRLSTRPYPNETHSQTGPDEKLVAVDGQTGKLLWQTPWPGTRPRVMMTVGQLRGFDKPGHAVVLDETYKDVTLTAVDGATGEVYWQVNQARPAGHNLDIADIDRDGVQEVICGGVCYNGDGTIRWEAEPFGHTDLSKPARIDPSREGLDIWYAVEGDNPGIYLVDKDGKTIFKEPYRHAHFGWVARHTTTVPGLQPHTAEDGRHEYGGAKAGMRQTEHNPIFLPDGSHWANLTEWQRKNFVPVHWDERPEVCFIIRKENKRVVRLLPDGEIEDVPDGKLPETGLYGRNLACADVIGDFRENIVTLDDAAHALIVLANPAVATRRGYSPWGDMDYRHDRSQHASGYYVYLSPPRTDITD